MAIMCGGGGMAFWLLRPGGSSDPNAWRAPSGNCKGYNSDGYIGLLNAKLNGGNIEHQWGFCGGYLQPLLFDPNNPSQPL